METTTENKQQILGAFDQSDQAQSAVAEIVGLGVDQDFITYVTGEPVPGDHVSGGSIIRVDASPAVAAAVRQVIDFHGGRTKIDDIPESELADPHFLHFAQDSLHTQIDEDPINESR